MAKLQDEEFMKIIDSEKIFLGGVNRYVRKRNEDRILVYYVASFDMYLIKEINSNYDSMFFIEEEPILYVLGLGYLYDKKFKFDKEDQDLFFTDKVSNDITKYASCFIVPHYFKKFNETKGLEINTIKIINGYLEFRNHCEWANLTATRYYSLTSINEEGEDLTIFEWPGNKE